MGKTGSVRSETDMIKQIANDIANVIVSAFRSGYCTIPHLDVFWWQSSSQWGRGECYDGGAGFLATEDGGDTRLVAILKRGALNRKDERSLFTWIKVPGEKETGIDDGDTTIFWGHESMKLKHGNASACCYTKEDYCKCSHLTGSDVLLFTLSFSLSACGQIWLEFVKAESLRVIESGKVFDFGESISTGCFDRMSSEIEESMPEE